GYTATRVIRDEMGFVDLPIIAVTAYALPEDREKSRRAGMAGHVVKPIDVDDLLDIILSRSGGGGGNRPAARVPLPPAGLPVLDLAAALRDFGGNKRKYGELLRQLFDRHVGDIETARRRFAEGDAMGVARMMHELCGGASFLRASGLARLAAAAEAALRAGRHDELPGLFDELQVAMHDLGESLEQIEASGDQ
ncbi:MAG: Hpt domain-containing protein, partial [Rhodocyclaceae bacterium]